jgi:hypothetical protein
MGRKYAFSLFRVDFLAWGVDKDGRRDLTIMCPRSAEMIVPFVVIDQRWAFDFFVQLRSPFGLFIRVPFLWLRWGGA